MPNKEPNEDDIDLKHYLKGDSAAFDRLYEKYRRRVFGYIRKSVTNEETANELFQEVWTRVISSADKLEHRGRFRQWLMTCSHNVIVDFYRRQKTDEVLEEDHGATRSETMALEAAERIERALLSLPFDQRQAFCLREYGACSIADVAHIQNCSTEAAKSRLRYAYQKLRQQLEDLI